jgi:hypothetical protein
MKQAKKIIIEIETKNSAFFDSSSNFQPEYEIQRLLKRLSNDLDHYSINSFNGVNIKDINGNTVGKIKINYR